MSEYLISQLTQSNYHFAAIPWMKEYLISAQTNLDPSIEAAFENILTQTGSKQFELLPLKYLVRSSSSSLRFVIAKKLYKKGSNEKALEYAKKVNPNHPIYPFTAHLMANIYSELGQHANAMTSFNDCERNSIVRLGSATGVLKRQLELNRDYCVAGTARALFAKKEFDKSTLKYLDIMKSSRIWPEILFEEAWSSYYQKDYNRTLGKLVTYKAPILNYIFNPEIEVLKALSYMKLCLYNDAKTVSDSFWNTYLGPSQALGNYLRNKGKNSKYFYRLMLDFEQTEKAPSELIANMLKSISRDGAYLEIKLSLLGAAEELKRVQNQASSRLKTSLISNLKEVINLQKLILGNYVRNRLTTQYGQLYRSFEGMSYIKLEVLSQRKSQLYNIKQSETNKRGDEKYIQRNDKQYFWNFNGEFWADELGDYVFALRSECQ